MFRLSNIVIVNFDGIVHSSTVVVAVVVMVAEVAISLTLEKKNNFNFVSHYVYR